MEKEKIELFNGWTTENVEPCDWSNFKRWSNYFAIITMDSNGDEHKEFFPESKEKDLYFNVTDAKPMDILIASCWDKRKSRQYKRFYIVDSKNDDEIILIRGIDEDNTFTTYRKAYKALQELKIIKK